MQLVAVKNLWAYAYEIRPPLPSAQLRTIRVLLKDATAAAQDAVRTWSARLVLERRVTHILIVSDDVGLDDAIKGRLDAELGRLDASFSVTAAMAVTPRGDANGNGTHP